MFESEGAIDIVTGWVLVAEEIVLLDSWEGGREGSLPMGGMETEPGAAETDADIGEEVAEGVTDDPEGDGSAAWAEGVARALSGRDGVGARIKGGIDDGLGSGGGGGAE